jgi:hypothetical protein
MAAAHAEDGVPDAACSGFTGTSGAFDSCSSQRCSVATRAAAGRTSAPSAHASVLSEARVGNSEGRRAHGGNSRSVVWRAAHASIAKRDSGTTVVAAAGHDSGTSFATAAIGVVKSGRVHRERQRVRRILHAVDTRAAARDCPAQADQPVPGK